MKLNSNEHYVLWQARNGAASRIRSMGYEVPAMMDENEIERRLKEGIPGMLDIFASRRVQGDQVVDAEDPMYVWFAEPTGVRSKPMNLASLREVVADIQKRAPGVNNLKMMLVLRAEDSVIRGLEDQMRKDDLTFRGRVQLFPLWHICWPVAEHVLQPKVERMTPEERDGFRQSFSADPLKDIPRFRDHDSLVRYMDFNKGTLVRILRPDGTVGYRIVE